MRVTIPHSKTKQELRDIVNRSAGYLFEGIAIWPLEIVDQQTRWAGDTLKFSLTARMGFLRTPIQGAILLGDKEVTIDVELGMLANLIPEEAAKNRIEGRVRGLLT